MSSLRIRLASLTVAAVSATGSVAHAADTGPDIARLLNLAYQDTRRDCGDPTRPAYLCSGVLLRATTPSTAYAFYSVSPKAQARGGVAASYLRKDAKYQHLAFGMTSGFVFNLPADNPADHADPPIRCAYPIDGVTDSRGDGGCGDYQRDDSVAKVVEGSCEQIGIVTAEQWVNRYFTATGSYKPSAGMYCAFDVRAGRAGAAEAFYQNLRADGILAARGVKFNGSLYQENELMIVPWAIDVPRSPSVLASFYVNNAGLAGARLDQIQWYQATRQVLPALRLTLPATAQQDARFDYEAGQQAILPLTEANQCERYVERASWIRRYDAGFKKEIWSLEVLPTDCGRRIQAGQTNNFVDELVADHYLETQWVNNPDNPGNVQSMRRQLVCVMTTARDKAAWFLEPSRPYTSHEKSIAAGCNNVAG